MRTKFSVIKTLLVLGVFCAVLLVGCGQKSESKPTETVPAKTTKSVSEKTTEPVYEYPSKDAKPISYDSPLGYSITFDPTLFCQDDASNTDSFTYMTSEKLKSPVFITVQLNKDMDTDTLVKGLALQSKTDDVKTENVKLGANKVKCQKISYVEDVKGVTVEHSFFVVPVKKENLLIEYMGYKGMPQRAEAKCAEMLDSITIK